MAAGNDSTEERYDFLVVGAGSCGAVMASRLSEDAHCRVLLLEAGPDLRPQDAGMASILNASQVAVVPGLHWNLQAAIRTREDRRDASVGRSGPVFHYAAGRLVGGSSAVNATQALRGAPEDFDAWARELGGAWSWQSVLPFYRLLEDDPVGPRSLHGSGGPMPIRREHRHELRPLQAGLMTACLDAGFAAIDDHNDPASTGVGIIPKNVVDGVRISTAAAYLAPARGRPNLTVAACAHGHRLLWKRDGQCDGVEAEVDGEVRRFLADRIVVCAGAVNTPALLMRSGIGAPAMLEPLDIEVRNPLRGVGANLMDHPVVGIWGIPHADACTKGEPSRQTLLRWTSRDSEYANDMHLSMVAGLDVNEMVPGRTLDASAIAGITVSNNRSASRGAVRITSPSADVAPEVSINCLQEKSDIVPLKEGVRLAWQLMQHGQLRERFGQIFAWSEGIIQSDLALERAIMAFVRPAAHLGGTAKMGHACDAGAVVDAQGRIHGTENVWIADASIMPCIPSAPTHLTCLMIAEKIAAGLRGGAT